ncbi:MAG: hypothetical protein IPO81_09630 [Kouleothrix sp.]|nr:hypothetical protein [Kouleothrix sp.]
MAERSQPWDSTGVGDGALTGYTEAQLEEFFRDLFTSDRFAAEGVLAGVGGELAVTAGSSLVTVAAGAGMTYGKYYQNTAAQNVSITKPNVGTTGLRVNLRVDWSAQTTRAYVNRNTDGTSAIPALVQTPSTTFDIPLATGTITTAGVVTLTDVRDFCHYPTALVYRRQGASAADWSQPGTTNYTPGEALIQCGSATVTWSSSSTSNLLTITFPQTFTQPPIVLLTCFGNGSSTGSRVNFSVETVAAGSCTVRGYLTDESTSSSPRIVFWVAIGPAT